MAYHQFIIFAFVLTRRRKAPKNAAKWSAQRAAQHRHVPDRWRRCAAACAGRACAPADQQRRFHISGGRSLGGLFYASCTMRITLMTRPTTQHCSGSASVDTCLIPLLKIIQLAKIRVHKLNIAETRIYRFAARVKIVQVKMREFPISNR